MKKRKTLKTERLILCPFKLSDAKVLQEKAGDRAIADTTLNIPYPFTEEIGKEWILTHQPQFESGKAVTYAIKLKETDELIGAVGLNISKEFNHADLGYWIEKDLWGNGYCTEAAKAVVEYGFNEFDLHRIIANHLTRNPSSGKVMQKLGMQQEGLFREHVIKWDKYEDVVYYGILRDEWNKLRDK